ncbi:MAG: hypothetical protein R2797_02455 [Gelidibacter sp.]
MNQHFKKRQTTFLLQNVIVSIVLFGIHSYLISYFATDTILFFQLWQIYLFHFVVTTGLYTVINLQYSNGKTEVFNTFMVVTFLKMTLSILFLLPLLLSSFENKQPDVFNFFIPYFLYLFFEVYSVTQFLQKKP